MSNAVSKLGNQIRRIFVSGEISKVWVNIFRFKGSQNVVKAELTQTEKGAVGGSWHVQDTEVIFKTRENRSSRPEVVYHLSPPSSIGRQYESTPELRPPVIHQPQLTPKLVWPSAPPFKDLATPSPVPSPIVKTLTYPQPRRASFGEFSFRGRECR